MKKLKLEVEALSQSEQMAAKSHSVKNEQVTRKYATFQIKYIKCWIYVTNSVNVNYYGNILQLIIYLAVFWLIVNILSTKCLF